MKTRVRGSIFCGLLLVLTSALTRSQVNPAMNTPDEVAWQLFIQVNTAAGASNALFETWASDTDTFQDSPQFPSQPTRISPHAPIVPRAGLEAIQAAGGLVPQIPPNPAIGEEARRNKTAFDFIVVNNLYKLSGLKVAFGKEISFPIDAIEVKANWMPVSDIPTFSGNKVSLTDVPKLYHVNTGSDGKQYAMVSMHIISKLVPNWTWATFEHSLNPARCDILGCIDRFGAQTQVVSPNGQANQGYPACTKSSALSALIAAAKWDKAFVNYCLKGSQTDFIDNTGLAVRLGNSVTEDGFVNRSSCMTCHGRAAFGANGRATSNAGFDVNGAPLGPIDPSWYWSFSNKPPIFAGMPGLSRTATASDFVWSIPCCAIDDTASPPKKSPCTGK